MEIFNDYQRDGDYDKRGDKYASGLYRSGDMNTYDEERNVILE
jgi:hypothetical protein